MTGHCLEYDYLDGTVVKGRWDSQVEPVSILVAFGIDESGYRHVLGVEAGCVEDATKWLRLLRSLRKRGVKAIDLITSDAHACLAEAREKAFPRANRERCVFHLVHNVLTQVPKRKQRQVGRALTAIFAQESAAEAKVKAHRFSEEHRKSLPQAANVLQCGLGDSLTYCQYPEKHWRSIRTDDPLERLLREVKRRLRVVGAFPNVDSAVMLATARLKWTEESTWSQRRYLDMEAESQAAVA